MVHTQSESELKIGEIKMSDHALQRAKERFNMDKNQAVAYFRSQLKNAIRIGEQFSEHGTHSVLYAVDRHAIYLSTDLKTILTVDRYEMVTHVPIKEKVREIHETELRKLRRRERHLVKHNKIEKLKLTIELSQLDYRLYKTKSKNVKEECRCRRKEIEKYIEQIDNELKQVRDTIRQVARSMVAVS